MTEYGLQPSFVVINYHNDRAPHKMTLPTTQWLASPNVGGAGAYSQWDAGTEDAFDMVHDFVEFLADLYTTATTFDDFVIYNYPTDDSDPQPVASGILDIDGTQGGTYVPAAQATFSFRTAGFNPFKLVTLDIVPSTGFLPTKVADFTSAQSDVSNYLTSADHAFAGRDGNRISQPIQITYTLNEKLRRAYRLT